MRTGLYNGNLEAGLDTFEKRTFLVLLSSLLFISLMLTNYAYSFGESGASKNNSLSARTMALTASTSPSDLNEMQKRLEILLQQHAILAAETTINLLEDRPEIVDSQKALDLNSVKIADVVGQFLGSAKKTSFLRLWKEHASLLGDYADAVKNSDTQQKVSVTRSLDQTTTALGNEFSQDNGLRNAVVSGMKEHISIEKAIVDAHQAGNFTTQYTLMNRSLEHSSMMVETIFDKLSQ